MTEKIAIVVVNFRTARLTLDCVRSLGSLDYPTVEIIVVDNASGDGSIAVLRRELPAAVELVEATANGGYTAGNNLGIAVARRKGCRFIHLLNPDTVVLNPGYLTKLMQCLTEQPRIGAVGPRVHWRTAGAIQNTVIEFPWLWRRVFNAVRQRVAGRPNRSGSEMKFVDALNGVCVLFRDDCLREAGEFDERIFAYVDEADWGLRARNVGWRLAYVPIDGVVHLQKDTGYARAGTVDFLLKRNTVFFLLKNRKFLQAAGYTASTALAGFILAARRRGQAVAWYRSLLKAYWWLWTARWNRAMGRPHLGTAS